MRLSAGPHAGAGARVNEEVTLRIFGNPFGFTDRMAGDDKGQYFLRDLQFRSFRLDFKLSSCPRLGLRVGTSALAMDP